MVLLDEVGLAEQSPHLPLKVLHKMFDEAGPGEGVVGISNWALDPAKVRLDIASCLFASISYVTQSSNVAYVSLPIR